MNQKARQQQILCANEHFAMKIKKQTNQKQEKNGIVNSYKHASIIHIAVT